MADKIKVNTARIGTDVGRILGYIGNMTKAMDNIKQSAAVLEQMWEGPGSGAFHQVFREDMEAVEAAVGELKGICAYDANAKSKYEQCERKIASMIAGINSKV